MILLPFPALVSPTFSPPPVDGDQDVLQQLRKVLKNRGHFPSDEAATKLIYLALRNITKKWKNPPVTWKAAGGQFAITFGARFFSSGS